MKTTKKVTKIYPQEVREWLAEGKTLIQIRNIFRVNGHKSVTLTDLRRLYGKK